MQSTVTSKNSKRRTDESDIDMLIGFYEDAREWALATYHKLVVKA